MLYCVILLKDSCEQVRVKSLKDANHFFSTIHTCQIYEQAGVELGQAQIKLELGFLIEIELVN